MRLLRKIVWLVVVAILMICVYNVYRHNMVFWRKHPFFHNLVNDNFKR